MKRKLQPHRLTPEQLEQLVADYKAGASIKALSGKYSIHTMTVQAHLRRAGVELPSSVKLAREVQYEVVRLYLAGKSVAMVSTLTCVSEGTVSRVLREHEVPPRRGPAPSRLGQLPPEPDGGP